jgi:hypothetical protein
MWEEIRERERLTKLETEKIGSKKQFVVNASVIEKRIKSTNPPFLFTVEIFNRNVHNCVVDLGASSNVMPLKFCEKLNVKPEKSDIQYTVR